MASRSSTDDPRPDWALRRDSDAYRTATRQAAQEAVARARGYAEALGCRLTGLVELSDEGLTQQGGRGGFETMAVPMSAMAGAPGAAEPEAIALEPEAQIVRAAVVARFTATSPELSGS